MHAEGRLHACMHAHAHAHCLSDMTHSERVHTQIYMNPERDYMKLYPAANKQTNPLPLSVTPTRIYFFGPTLVLKISAVRRGSLETMLPGVW